MYQHYNIIQVNGLNPDVVQHIGSFAMNPKVIRELGGYPLLTGLDFEWWIVRDGDRVIGFSALKQNKHYSLFTYSYVVHEFRRNGIHASLVQERIKWCKDNDAQLLKADCTAGSIRQFVRLGFVVTKQFKGWTKLEMSL